MLRKLDKPPALNRRHGNSLASHPDRHGHNKAHGGGIRVLERVGKGKGVNLASVGTVTAQFPSHWNVTGFASGKHPVHCQLGESVQLTPDFRATAHWAAACPCYPRGMRSGKTCRKVSWKNWSAFFAAGRAAGATSDLRTTAKTRAVRLCHCPSQGYPLAVAGASRLRKLGKGPLDRSKRLRRSNECGPWKCRKPRPNSLGESDRGLNPTEKLVESHTPNLTGRANLHRAERGALTLYGAFAEKQRTVRTLGAFVAHRARNAH